MTTQLDFEKSKKRTSQSDVKTNKSQVLFPPTPDKKLTNELIADQVFCSLCESYHKPNSKLTCALNRAIRKMEVKNISRKY
jgi:hypothetical protein